MILPIDISSETIYNIAKMKTILIILILFIFLLINSNIIINEVMANVEGRDSGVMSPGDRNEFIEIYNGSSDTIVLTGYRLFDGNAYDNILKWSDSISPEKGIINVEYLPPRCYGVILDPEYCLIGDELNMPYEFCEETYIFTISNTTFGDNGLSTVDCISLFDNNDKIVSSFGTPDEEDGFPYDCGDGISLERVNPYAKDTKGNWKPCNDLSGNSAGIKNSVYTENAVIDTMIYFNNTLTIYFAYMPVSGTILIVESPCLIDTIQVLNDSITIDVGKQDVFNVNIKGNLNIYTFIKPVINNKYKILFSEFFVHGSDKEWIEIKNECGIDYYGDLTIINNDTLIMEDITIPNGSYFVLSEDTQLLKYDYPYITNCLNIKETSISLPNRQDTFLLLINDFTIDSVIRGYEDRGDRSIEKINGTRGCEILNWDMCVDDYGGTPLKTNSLSPLSNISDNLFSVDKHIADASNPIINLIVKSHCSINTINVKIYSETGNLVNIPIIDKLISSDEIIPIKCNNIKTRHILHILFIELENDSGKFYGKIPIGIR